MKKYYSKQMIGIILQFTVLCLVVEASSLHQYASGNLKRHKIRQTEWLPEFASEESPDNSILSQNGQDLEDLTDELDEQSQQTDQDMSEFDQQNGLLEEETEVPPVNSLFNASQQSLAQAGFFEHIFRQGKSPKEKNGTNLYHQYSSSNNTNSTVVQGDNITIQKGGNCSCQAGVSNSPGCCKKNSIEITRAHSETSREISALYHKFAKVIARLRQRELREWKMRMSRIKMQQALIGEKGSIMSQRNKHYYERIMALMKDEAAMRREHTEEMKRLRHEEEQLLNSAHLMESKNHDQEKVLKLKILEYEKLEEQALKGLSDAEKARREELREAKKKALEEEEARRKEFNKEEADRKEKERKEVANRAKEEEKRMKEAEERLLKKLEEERRMREKDARNKRKDEEERRKKRDAERAKRDKKWRDAMKKRDKEAEEQRKKDKIADKEREEAADKRYRDLEKRMRQEAEERFRRLEEMLKKQAESQEKAKADESKKELELINRLKAEEEETKKLKKQQLEEREKADKEAAKKYEESSSEACGARIREQTKEMKDQKATIQAEARKSREKARTTRSEKRQKWLKMDKVPRDKFEAMKAKLEERLKKDKKELEQLQAITKVQKQAVKTAMDKHEEQSKQRKEILRKLKNLRAVYSDKCLKPASLAQGPLLDKYLTEKKVRQSECNEMAETLTKIRTQIPPLRKALAESCKNLQPQVKEFEANKLKQKSHKEIVEELEEEIEDIKIPEQVKPAEEIHFFEYIDPFAHLEKYKSPDPFEEPAVQQISMHQFVKKQTFKIVKMDMKSLEMSFGEDINAVSLKQAFHRFVEFLDMQNYFYEDESMHKYEYLLIHLESGKPITSSKAAPCALEAYDFSRCSDRDYNKKMFAQQIFKDSHHFQALIGWSFLQGHIKMGKDPWGPFEPEVKEFGKKGYIFILQKIGDKPYRIKFFEEKETALARFNAKIEKGFAGVLFKVYEEGGKMKHEVVKISSFDDIKAREILGLPRFKQNSHKGLTQAYAVISRFMMDVGGYYVMPVFKPDTIDIPRTDFEQFDLWTEELDPTAKPAKAEKPKGHPEHKDLKEVKCKDTKTKKEFKKVFYTPAELMFSYVNNKESDPLVVYPHDQVKRAGAEKEDDGSSKMFDMDDWGDDDDLGFDDEEEDEEDDKPKDKQEDKEKKAAKAEDKAKKKKNDFGDSWGMDWDDDEDEDYGGLEFYSSKIQVTKANKAEAVSLDKYKSIYHKVNQIQATLDALKKERTQKKESNKPSQVIKTQPAKKQQDTKSVKVVNKVPIKKQPTPQVIKPVEEKHEQSMIKTPANLSKSTVEKILEIEKKRAIDELKHLDHPSANLTIADALKKADQAIMKHKAEKKKESKKNLPKAEQKQILKSSSKDKVELKSHNNSTQKVKSSIAKKFEKMANKTSIQVPAAKVVAPKQEAKPVVAKIKQVLKANSKPIQTIKKGEMKHVIQGKEAVKQNKTEPAKPAQKQPIIHPSLVKKASNKSTSVVIKKTGQVHVKNLNATKPSKPAAPVPKIGDSKSNQTISSSDQSSKIATKKAINQPAAPSPKKSVKTQQVISTPKSQKTVKTQAKQAQKDHQTQKPSVASPQTKPVVSNIKAVPKKVEQHQKSKPAVPAPAPQKPLPKADKKQVIGSKPHQVSAKTAVKIAHPEKAKAVQSQKNTTNATKQSIPANKQIVNNVSKGIMTKKPVPEMKPKAHVGPIKVAKAKTATQTIPKNFKPKVEPVVKPAKQEAKQQVQNKQIKPSAPVSKAMDRSTSVNTVIKPLNNQPKHVQQVIPKAMNSTNSTSQKAKKPTAAKKESKHVQVITVAPKPKVQNHTQSNLLNQTRRNQKIQQKIKPVQVIGASHKDKAELAAKKAKKEQIKAVQAPKPQVIKTGAAKKVTQTVSENGHAHDRSEPSKQVKAQETTNLKPLPKASLKQVIGASKGQEKKKNGKSLVK